LEQRRIREVIIGSFVNWLPFEWIRNTFSSGESQEAETEQAERDSENPSSRLFECPSCGRVYVGEDKETCSECDEPVKKIPK